MDEVHNEAREVYFSAVVSLDNFVDLLPELGNPLEVGALAADRAFCDEYFVEGWKFETMMLWTTRNSWLRSDECGCEFLTRVSEGAPWVAIAALWTTSRTSQSSPPSFVPDQLIMLALTLYLIRESVIRDQ
jgi:hypothetical protein